MARLRFPGRPGQRFGRNFVQYDSDEIRLQMDSSSKIIRNVQKGLRLFYELFGYSDEEEEFEGFTKEDLQKTKALVASKLKSKHALEKYLETNPHLSSSDLSEYEKHSSGASESDASSSSSFRCRRGMRDILRKSYDRMIKDGLCQPLVVKGSTVAQKSNRAPKFYLKNKAPFSSRKPVLRKFSIEQVTVIAPEKEKCALNSPVEDVQNREVTLETRPAEKVKTEGRIKRKNKLDGPAPNRTTVKPTKTAARRLLEKAKRGCARGRRKQKGEIGRNVKKKLRKKYQISPKKRKFEVVKNIKSSQKSNCREQKTVNDILSKTKHKACPGVVTRGHSTASKSSLSHILKSSSDHRQSPSVQNNNRSLHRSVSPQKRSLSVGRKKFVLPPVSARSSRRIIPRKRYLDSVESPGNKCKQIKDDDSESSKSARSCILGNILPAESGSERADLHDEKYVSGSRRKIGLLDQPLVVEGKRPWKPSLKVQMKLSEMSYDSPFGLRKSDDRSSGTGTSSGSFKDIIKPDMVSKYADIMAKRGKEKTVKSADSIKKSTPESSKAASETSKSGFVESVENDIRKSEERLEKVAAKIERLLKSQWEGRLKRADDNYSQSMKINPSGNQEKEVESALSRWKNEDQQRASNQKRTKSIIRKAKLQLKKRTLMRLRRTLDVKVASDLPPPEVSQSIQDMSRSMSACAAAEETPVPSKLNQCASPAQRSQQGVVTCCVCGLSKNQIVIQRRYRRLTCQWCINFFGNFTRAPQQFFCPHSGNCSLQGSVSSEKFCSVLPVTDSRCKACWLKRCLEKLTVSSLLRERLMTFVPRLEISQDPLIKDKISEQQGSFAFADLVQTAEIIKKETTTFERIDPLLRENPSDSQETSGSDNIKSGFPDKPSSSTNVELHTSWTHVSEIHANSAAAGEISAHISENKNSENQIIPVVDEIKVHGPRIKHVCRRAAVVLGLPRATFPAPSNEASFNLSALPQEEKQKILEIETVPQEKTSTYEDKLLPKNCDKKNSKGNESETKVKNSGESLKKQLPLHKRQKKKKLIKKSLKHLHKHSFKKPLKLGHKTTLKKPNKFSYKTALNKAPIKSALKLPLKRPVRPARFRKVRCKECEGCLAEDCGECVYCLDKKKFGGPNLIKQACMFRRCLRPVMPATEKKASKPQSEGGGDGKPSGGHSSFGGGGPSGIGTSLSTSSSSSPSSSPDGSSCGSSCSSSSSSSSSSGSSSSNSSSSSSSSSNSNSSSSSKSSSSSSNSGKRSTVGVFSNTILGHTFKQLSTHQDFGTEPVPPESVAFNEEIETGLFCASSNPYNMDYKLPVDCKVPMLETCCNSPCSSERSSSKNSPARQKAVPVRKPAPPVDKEKRGFNRRTIDLQTHGDWNSDDTYRVNASYWEDYNMEKIYSQGFTLISSQYIPLRTPCFLCGSAGVENLIFCVVCCEPFHTACLSKTDVPLKENIDNWCCYRCQSCAVCGQKSGHKYNTKGHHSQKLLKCKKCQNSYHADCLGPNYPSKPSRKKRIWVCPKCVRCKSCGTTTPTPGTGLLWNFDLLLCQSCTKLTEKGNFCPICHRCYEEDDYESQMVQCYKCDRWVHAKCDNISDEMYEILSCLPENIVYTCINCTTENPPFWRVAINNALKNGLKTIISALLNARCTRHLISRKDNGTSASVASIGKTSSNSSPVIKYQNIPQDALSCESLHTEESDFQKTVRNSYSSMQHENPSLDGRPRNVSVLGDLALSSDQEHKVICPTSAVENLENQEKDISLTDFSSVSVIGFRSLNNISNLGKTSHETILTGKSHATDWSRTVPEKKQNPECDYSSDICKVLNDTTELTNSNQNDLLGSMDVVNLNSSPAHCRSSISGHESLSNEKFCSTVNSDEMIISRNKSVPPVENSNDNQPLLKGFTGKVKCITKKEHSLHNYLDLMSVKRKIESGKYSSVESFFDEIIQIFESGYSDAKKIYAQAARSMFAKQLEKVFPWFKLSHHKLWNGEKTPSPRNGLLSDAFVPPSADHTYAQYMVRDPPAAVVQPHKYRNLLGGDFHDPRKCVLCGKTGDISPFESGRLLYCGQDDWIHVNCAVWSAEVIQMQDGLLQNIYPAISRGKLLRCESCKQFGATVGCCVRGCPANYHFNCAKKEDAVFQVDKTVFCSLHVNNAEEEFVEDEDFAVDECVFVGQNEIKPKWIKKSWQDGIDLRSLHVVIGSLTVENFGYLTHSSDSPTTLIPVNFRCTRIFWSTKNPHQRVVYKCRTVEVLPEIADVHPSCENLTIAHDSDELHLTESLTCNDNMCLTQKSESDVMVARTSTESASPFSVMDNNLKKKSLCFSITSGNSYSTEFSGSVQQIVESKVGESSAEFPCSTLDSVEVNDTRISGVVSQSNDFLSNTADVKVPEKEVNSSVFQLSGRKSDAVYTKENFTICDSKTSDVISCDNECIEPYKYSTTEGFELFKSEKVEKINGTSFSKIHCKKNVNFITGLSQKEKGSTDPSSEPPKNAVPVHTSDLKTVGMVLWDIINKVNINNKKEHHIKKDSVVLDIKQPYLEKSEKAFKNGSLQDGKVSPSKSLQCSKILKRKVTVSPSDPETDWACVKSGNCLPGNTNHRKEIKNLIRQIENGNGPVNGCNGKLQHNQHQISIPKQKDRRVNGIRDKHFQNNDRSHVPDFARPPSSAIGKNSENFVLHAEGRSEDSDKPGRAASKNVLTDQVLNSGDRCVLREKLFKSAKLNGSLPHQNKAFLSFPQVGNNENSEMQQAENMKSSDAADLFLNELVDCNANHKDHDCYQESVPKLPLKQALENCSQCSLNLSNCFLSLAKDAEPPDRAGSQCDKINRNSGVLGENGTVEKPDGKEEILKHDLDSKEVKTVDSVLKKSKLPKILRTYPLRSSSYRESVKLGRDMMKREIRGDLNENLFSKSEHENCNLVPKKGDIDICDATFPHRNVTQTVLPVYNVSCDHSSKNVDGYNSSKQGKDGDYPRQLRATPARLSMFYDQQNSMRRAEKELMHHNKKLKGNDKRCEKKNGYVSNCVKRDDIKCVNGNDFNLQASDEKLPNGCLLEKYDLSSQVDAVAAETNFSVSPAKAVSTDDVGNSVDLKGANEIKNSSSVLTLVNGNDDTLGPFKCSQCKRYYRTKSSFEKHVVSCDFVVDSSSTEDEDEVQNNQIISGEESLKKSVTTNTKQLEIKSREYSQCTEAVSLEHRTPQQNDVGKLCHQKIPDVSTVSNSKSGVTYGTVKENLPISANFGVSMNNSNQHCTKMNSLECSTVEQNEKRVSCHETHVGFGNNTNFGEIIQNSNVLTELSTDDFYSRTNNSHQKISSSNFGCDISEVSSINKEVVCNSSVLKKSCGSDTSQQPAPAKRIKLMESTSECVEANVQPAPTSNVLHSVCSNNLTASQIVMPSKRSCFNAVSSSSLKKIVPRVQGQFVHQNIAKSSKSPPNLWHRTSAQPVLHSSQNVTDYNNPVQADVVSSQACINSVQGVIPDLLNPIGKNVVDYSNNFFNSTGTMHLPNGMLINPSVISQIQTVNGSYAPILQEDLSLRQSHQYSYVGSVTITNMEAMSVSVNIPGQAVPNVDLLQTQLYPTQNLNFSQPVLMQNPLQLPPGPGTQLSSTLHVQELSIQNCVQNSGLRTIAFSQEAAISGLQTPVMYLDNMQLQQPVNSFAACSQLPGTIPHMSALGNHQQTNCAYQPFITNSPEQQIHAPGLGQYPYSSDVQNIPFQVCHPDPEVHQSIPQAPTSHRTHAVIPNQGSNAPVLSFTPFESSFEEQAYLLDFNEETKSDSSSSNASMQVETPIMMSENKSPCVTTVTAENGLVSVSNSPKNNHIADILCKAAEQMMSLAHMSKKPPESPASLSDSSSSELPVKKSRFEHTRKVAARKAHLMKNKLRLSHQASVRSSQTKIPKGTFQLSLGMINSQRIPFLPAASLAHEDEQSSDSSTVIAKSTVQPFPVTKTQPITGTVPEHAQDPYELSEEYEEESPLLAAHLLKERSNVGSTSNLPKDKPYIMFEISSEDGFYIKSPNVNDAWKAVYDKLQNARVASHMKQINISPEDIDGIQMMGLKNNTLRYILEQLSGAENCTEYNFSFHPPCREEDETPKNPSGCARCEPFSGRKGHDMFNFLASEHRQRPTYEPAGDNEEGVQKCSRRATGVDLSIAMRFRNLKNIAREAVGVYRSNIHGRGLFCKRNIDAGELVIEYAGQVIRPELADKRELIYQSKGIGCYMFRIDDNDDVVDATMHGNAARFINHSCEPNCFSKVITVDGKKHIVIFALRRILKGEELTYDYKFPFEEEKIPCTCHSRRCRKYLN